jgi:PAS domain S-box-containing protein
MSVFDIDPVVTPEKISQIGRMLERNGVATHETIHRRRDGTTFPVEITTNLVEFQGKRYGISFVKDITERKRTEEALRESKERFRSLVETSSDWIWEVDSRGFYTYASPKVKDILGYEPMEVIGKTPFDLMPVQEAERVRKQFADLAESGESFCGLENVNLHKSGHLVILETSGVPIFDAHGRLSGYRGIDRDITERKRADDALRFTQYAVDSAITQAFWIKPDGHISYVNDTACRSLGYSRDELLGMTIPDIDPTFTPEIFAEYWRRLKEKGSITIEAWQRARDGRVYPIEVNSNYVVFDGKEYNCSFVTDITERKRAEEALRESEEKFRVLAETAPAAIVLHQGEKFIYANPATTRYFGYSEKELLKMNFWDWANEDSREMLRERGVARLRGENVPLQYEYKMFTKGGDERWVVISAGTVEYLGKPAVIATILDITETKQAVDRINAALAEKVVLLKEVHHRVKNNLQIISTLLDLQSESIHDSAALEAFRESQDRIKAMALIHERLYDSEDLASVDFARYIEALSGHLINSYLVDPERITLQVDAGGVSMGIDKAIPCGLIINELISNALKYAFPGDRPGEIKVSFQRAKDGSIILRVEDNGVGLPAGLEITNTGTLGLQLVTMLARQLRGVLTVESEHGRMSFSMIFPGK